jgi:hypothetical protein
VDTFVASRRATDANGSSGQEGHPVAAATERVHVRDESRELHAEVNLNSHELSNLLQDSRCAVAGGATIRLPTALAFELQPNPDQLLFGIIPLDQALLSGRLQTRTH